MTIGQKIPKVPKVYTEEEIKINKELAKFRGCYIFVNTNFKRKGEPIFALAFCESQRNIGLNKNNLIFKSDDEIFAIISAIVKEHYEQSNGKAGIWGNIVNYVYHHSDGETYIFDTNGNQIESYEVVESRASLRLK
jgi:hypothetical protein